MLKTYDSSCKYNTNIIDSTMLKYSMLNFIDMPLFMLCVIKYVYKRAVSIIKRQ